METKKAPLIVLSGPSGCGKSTIIRQLLERGDLPLHLSVSATTRGRRPSEQEGADYFYLTREEFEVQLQAGAFLEHAKVVDHYYGTLRCEVEPYRSQGVGVVLDIDTQGKAAVCRQCPDALSIFLLASSPASYEDRLRKRGTESETAIQRRIANGLRELQQAHAYNFRVLNDDMGTAVAEVHRLVTQAFERDKHAG